MASPTARVRSRAGKQPARMSANPAQISNFSLNSAANSWQTRPATASKGHSQGRNGPSI